jgi:hypothetical protein
MDTIRRVLKATQQTDKPRMLVRVETVEKMLKEYDELRAMMVAFRHAANSIGVEAGITKSHIDHDEAAQSVCGDHLYIEMISEAEERFKRQAVENDQLKAQVERMRELMTELSGRYNQSEWIATPINRLLNETPAQCLTEARAAELERYADHLGGQAPRDELGNYARQAAQWMRQEAQQLRQEALSNG